MSKLIKYVRNLPGVLVSITVLCISIFYSTETVAQDYWQKLNSPDSLSLTDVLVDEQGYIYISCWESFGKGGVYRSDDNGISWSKKIEGFSANHSALSLAVDGYNNLFAGGQSRIYKSTDHGENWVNVFANVQYASNYNTIRCGFDSIVIAGGEYCYGIIRSGDHGDTWKVVLDISHLNSLETITDIAFGPDGVIYACSRIIYTNDPGKIYASYDLGLTWQVFYVAEYPMALGFDNSGRLLLGEFGVGLFRYDFQTGIWEHIPSTSGVSPQAILTVPDDKIFLGCYSWPSHVLAGVMLSNDGGESYSFLNSGFSYESDVGGFAVDAAGRVLVYSGACLYRSYDTVFTHVSEKISKSKMFTVCPNPFTDHLIIRLPWVQGKKARLIKLYDAYGRIIFEDTFAGNEYYWDAVGYPPGLYVVKITDEKSSGTIKVLHY